MRLTLLMLACLSACTSWQEAGKATARSWCESSRSCNCTDQSCRNDGVK